MNSDINYQRVVVEGMMWGWEVGGGGGGGIGKR